MTRVVSPRDVPASKRLLKPRDVPLTVWVSHHDPRKGVDFLIRALADRKQAASSGIGSAWSAAGSAPSPLTSNAFAYALGLLGYHARSQDHSDCASILLSPGRRVVIRNRASLAVADGVYAIR